MMIQSKLMWVYDPPIPVYTYNQLEPLCIGMLLEPDSFIGIANLTRGFLV